jgi:hypothetical protein
MVLRSLKIVLGSVMFAGVIYAIVAAPGFLSDSASTVPAQHQIAMVRP